MPHTSDNTTQQPDKSNIQGLILHGYTHPCSVHLMFKFNNGTGVPGFFKAMLPYLRSAEDWGPVKPEMMLNISLTWGGIAIARPDLRSGNFPVNFVAGPAVPYNSPGAITNPQSALHDTGPSAPENWWNKRFTTDDIHCVVHAYAMHPEAQEKIVGIITAAATASNGSVTELFPLESETGRLEQYPLKPNNSIHFGYQDSIDAPALNPAPQTPDQSDLNNFLIGYPPIALPGPVNGPEGIFAKDGCYNAFRVLFQDVPAFEDFLDKQSETIAPQIGKPKEYAREWLAAKINGRWFNGSPLVLSPDAPDPETADATVFDYLYPNDPAKDDSKAFKCPFSSHTRVCNPRDGALLPANKPVPHLLRRGMPYGAPLKKDKSNSNEDRGLIGLFLCGDLASQFQKIYHWINFNDFSPFSVFPYPHRAQDALIANRTPQPGEKIDTSFTIELGTGKKPLKILDLPQFVVTRGTAYCLLPSISSIREIAGVK